MGNLLVFSDGSYKPSTPNQSGGCGLVFVKDEKVIYKWSKRYDHTTNNKCELLAVIHVLNAISKPLDSLTIYTDSQYVIGCATKGWQRKKNAELWKLYDKYYQKASSLCKKIEFVWCKGHTNKDDFISKMNDIADNLAQNAALTI